MKRFCYPFAFLLIMLLMPGCFSITRTERDVYKITLSDTIVRQEMKNTPGERENGTIYPSPRTVEIARKYVQQDSSVERYYPAFLRLGGVETASFLAVGGSTDGSGHGLFGLYDLLSAKRPDESKIFTANMFRFMPYEVRLRWFHDAPGWTIGTAATEIFTLQQDASSELDPGEYLIGVAPIYIRKRFFFREEPPYIMAVPFFGFSGPWGPSYYVNLGSTLDIGSYGGFNLRAYAGFLAGTSLLITDPSDPLGEKDYSMSFPYLGIGVSALDFVNKTEELFIEWKDHDHSALEVSALNVDIVHGFTDKGLFLSDANSGSSGSSNIFSGGIFRFASATFPLPYGDRRWFVGTSLFNLIAISNSEIAFGFLPIRTGYRFNVLYDELNFEPFGELTYYPSTAIHLGGRLVMEVPELFGVSSSSLPFTINLVGGIVSGSTNLGVLTGLEDLEAADSFTTGYIGFGIGIGSVLHTPAEVMRK